MASLSVTDMLEVVNDRIKSISHHLKQRDSHSCSWKADNKVGLSQALILRKVELQRKLNSKLRGLLFQSQGPDKGGMKP